MSVTEKFSAIRKGLLEFLILRIIASDKVYVADMLTRLKTTEFATQEGTLYPLLSKMRREGLVDHRRRDRGRCHECHEDPTHAVIVGGCSL